MVLKFFLFFILFLLIVLIFCPIKFKIKIILSEKDLQVFFYKYNIFSLSNLIKKKKEKSCNENCEDNCNEIKEDKKVKKKEKLKKSISFNVKKLISILYYNRFKPSLKFSLDMTYSTEDAALTAISYGLIQQFFSILYLMFDSFFRLKKFSKEINPKFNDINSIFFEIDSIITISFAQIIYIGFLYLIPQRKR